MPEQTLPLTERDRRRIVRKRRSIEAAVRQLVEQPECSSSETAADDTSETREIFERRRADRRRQIDPTTCERDYSAPQIEFMRAMDDYKRRSGRPFPTWSEVLEVVMSLGYRKVAEPTTMAWRTHGDSSRDDSGR
ncbi:MAG: hypothetical protein RL215_1667 [Planctomycetota bacterium]|jgi:hypothetical protein